MDNIEYILAIKDEIEYFNNTHIKLNKLNKQEKKSKWKNH